MLAPFVKRSNRVIVEDERMHRLAVWDLDAGKLIARLPRHPNRDAQGDYEPIKTVLSENGQFLASASNDGSVKVWDLNKRVLLGQARIGGSVTSLAFNTNGKHLAVGKSGAEVVVLRVLGQ
jgi:WD40 repeat protein